MTAAALLVAALLGAGCSSVVQGQAHPSGEAPAGGGAPEPGGPLDQGGAAGPFPGGSDDPTSGGGLCDTLTPDQLTELGMPGATGRPVEGAASACHWSVPGSFLPVALLVYPDTDLQTAAAAAATVGEYQQTQVAGLPAFEGGAPGTDVCGVLVAVGPDVVSVVAPRTCEVVRRMAEMVIPNLPS